MNAAARRAFGVSPFAATAALCFIVLAARALDWSGVSPIDWLDAAQAPPGAAARSAGAAPKGDPAGRAAPESRAPQETRAPTENRTTEHADGGPPDAALDQRAVLRLGPEPAPGAGPEDEVSADGDSDESDLAASDDAAVGESAPLRDGWMSSSEFEELRAFPESDLARRLRELEEREARVEVRELAQDALRDALDAQLARLEELKADIEALMAGLGEEEEQRLQDLVGVYTKMKPKAAATVFEQLDLDLLVLLFRRMSGAKSAPILAAMTPERAREVTAALARARLPALR